MKVLLDTSVLVAALVDEHGDYVRSFAILDRVLSGKDDGYVAAHSLAEIYSVFTRSPPPMRHSPEQALRSLEENVLNFFKISSLSSADYVALVRDAALAGIQGGAIYDAVLLKSAAKAEVERIYTLNLRHFQALAPPDIIPRIFSP
jgi:predicted nucleic acid-binding protein